jgi:hypothetical protein
MWTGLVWLRIVTALACSVAQWLRHYATNWKVVGSILVEVIFLNLLIASGRSRPVTEMSTRYIKIMFLGIKVRRVRKSDNLTAICEPTV